MYFCGVNVVKRLSGLEQSISEDNEQKLNFLYNAIQDTQETIKFTDTKSGTIFVLGTAFITAIVTLVDKYINLFNNQIGISKWILIIGSILFGVCLFVSLYLSLKSINPSNNPNEHIEFGDVDYEVNVNYYLTGLNPSMRFRDYIWECKDSKFSTSVEQYFNSISKVGPEGLLLSLTYEFIKLSYIKEKKYKRTQCALKWLVACLFTAGFTAIAFILSQNIDAVNINGIINKNLNDKSIYWLIIGYFVVRIVLTILFQSKTKISGLLNALLKCCTYSLIIGVIGYYMAGISIFDVILIFLTSLTIERINFSALLKKMRLIQEDSNTRISLLLNDFLHIAVLITISFLKI